MTSSGDENGRTYEPAGDTSDTDCDVQTARGAFYDDGHALSRLIGTPKETLAAVVARALASTGAPALHG